VNEEPDARPSVRPLLLDELVLARDAAQARRQDLVEDADHVHVQEGHAPARELLEAPHVAEMAAPPVRLHRAAARPPLEGGAVPERDVEEDERRRPAE
jgi:hypothetical protein